MSGRVRIGTCSSPADAAFVRSMFEARGLDIFISAEHHASLLGAAGSSFLSLDIWVAGEDADEASALLRDLRESDVSDDGEDTGDEGEGGESEGDEADDELAHERQALAERRRITAGVLFRACCITFGTAHMATGAWTRGFALAALEIFGILQVLRGHGVGTVAIVAAIAADLIGALWRVHVASQLTLPTARVRRG